MTCPPCERRRRVNHLLKIARRRWVPVSTASSPALLAKLPPSAFARANTFRSARAEQFTAAISDSSLGCRNLSRTSRSQAAWTKCVHVVTTWLRSLLRTKPLWGLVGNRLWSTYSERVSYTSQAPIVLGQIYETDRDMIIQRLPRLASLIEKQRSNADYYSRNLTVDADMLCSETPGAFFNRLQYPLLVPTSGQCDRLAALLREKQISTARPYKDIAAIAATHYGYNGDCPRAERIAKSVLVIPCNHALRVADVERIATCVNRAWSEVADRRQGVGLRSSGSAIDPPQRGHSEGVAEPHHSS